MQWGLRYRLPLNPKGWCNGLGLPHQVQDSKFESPFCWGHPMGFSLVMPVCRVQVDYKCSRNSRDALSGSDTSVVKRNKKKGIKCLLGHGIKYRLHVQTANKWSGLILFSVVLIQCTLATIFLNILSLFLSPHSSYPLALCFLS